MKRARKEPSEEGLFSEDKWPLSEDDMPDSQELLESFYQQKIGEDDELEEQWPDSPPSQDTPPTQVFSSF